MMKRRYKIIYNQDCTHIFHITKEPIKSKHVIDMIDEIANAGVDLILINPNSQKTNYPSKVWETYWKEYEGKDMPFYIKQMKLLAEQGYDYLEITLKRCREKNVSCGVSIRMNDRHGGHNSSTFYKQHPEYWLGRGFNYEYKEVRFHYLNLITEIVERYDFDVLELDFMRFPNYFKSRDYEKNQNIMIEFIKQVKKIIEQKNQNIALYIRVASMPSSAYEQGFDLKRLSKEKIVDGIVFTEFLNTGWEMPANEFREIAGRHIALYAGADVSADRRPGLPVRYMPYNELLLSGFAYAYLSSGADGIYFFNFFTMREDNKDPGELRFDMFKNIKDVKILKGRPKTYLITSNVRPHCETDLPHQIPVNICPYQSRSFSMLFGEEPEDCNFLFRVNLLEDISCEQLWLTCNLFSAGNPFNVKNVSPREVCSQLISSTKISGTRAINQLTIADFLVPSNAIFNGENQIILRNLSENEINVYGIETYFLPAKGGI